MEDGAGGITAARFHAYRKCLNHEDTKSTKEEKRNQNRKNGVM